MPSRTGTTSSNRSCPARSPTGTAKRDSPGREAREADSGHREEHQDGDGDVQDGFEHRGQGPVIRPQTPAGSRIGYGSPVPRPNPFYEDRPAPGRPGW